MKEVGWSSRAAIIGHWALILAVAVALRIRDLDRYSLWYDEVVTMRLARTATPAELIALLGQIDGTRAPLHPVLLQGWLRLFGTSELAARSFSAVCGIVTVAAVYVLGRRLFDDRTGRWAAWFAAVCPPLVYYSQEARMYAWLVLLTCLSWLVFLEFRKTAGWRTEVLYGLSLTALVYSHPLGLFMVAAHGLAYLLVRKSLALGLRSWLAIQAAVALAIAPWLPRYLDHGTDYPLPRYSLRFLLAVPIEYVGGNGIVLLACLTIIAIGLVSLEHRRLESVPKVGGRGSRRAVLQCAIPGDTGPPASPAPVPLGGSLALPRGFRDRLLVVSHVTENLILLSWLVLPPVAMFVYSRIGRPIFGPARYHLFIAPAYLILLARGLCRLPVLPRFGLAAGAFALSLSAIDAHVYSQVVKADWRGLSAWLDRGGAAKLAGPGQGPITVVVRPSDPRFPRDQVEAARYYLSPRHLVVLGESGSPGRVGAQAGQVVLEVDCLSAEQVREGDNAPEFYGLMIRRR